MSASTDESPKDAHIHFFKQLFDAEKNHNQSIYEACLPTEKELQNLISLTLINTAAKDWPDDQAFDHELKDRLQYNFREKLLSDISNTKLTPSDDVRRVFYQQQSIKIAMDTFRQVMEEYQASTNDQDNTLHKTGLFL